MKCPGVDAFFVYTVYTFFFIYQPPIPTFLSRTRDFCFMTWRVIICDTMGFATSLVWGAKVSIMQSNWSRGITRTLVGENKARKKEKKKKKEK